MSPTFPAEAETMRAADQDPELALLRTAALFGQTEDQRTVASERLRQMGYDPQMIPRAA